MKHSNFLALKAVLSLIYGIAFALIPTAIWSIFGMAIDPAGVFLTRFTGGFVIGIGLICWLGRNAEHQARQGITLALFIGDIQLERLLLECELSFMRQHPDPAFTVNTRH